ncbi:hypothetical protein [Paramesorhizobium deserti]|uniref:hypothetical protein n=1 Tax=Paramesorhizobium deserti TaxID=1494590 RepID=UPI00129006E4|nr:hypothetical protein [Paramesorhizobium deserti]
MKVIIEFYRVRAVDTAHARVGRVSRSVADADDAIRLARSLLLSLDMPQEPDFIAILDDQENAFYCASAIPGHEFGSTQTAEVSVWENEGGAVHRPTRSAANSAQALVSLPIYGDTPS